MALMDCSKPRLRSLSPSSRTRTSCKQKITLKYRVISLHNHGLRDQEISLFCFLLEIGSGARILYDQVYDDLTSKLFENSVKLQHPDSSYCSLRFHEAVFLHVVESFFLVAFQICFFGENYR